MLKLKLQTKILFSYLILLGIVIGGFYFIFDVLAINILTRAHLKTAVEGIDGLSASNREALQKTVRRLGTYIIDLIAEREADRAALYLAGKPPEYRADVAALRRDPAFRAIVAHPIMVYGREAGYTDLFDLSGTALLHPYARLEGKNYRDWVKEYPRMWEIVQQSFTRKFVSGNYTFFDDNNKSVEKYMAICRVPGTNYNLVASVIIGEFFTPIDRNIVNNEEKLSQAACGEISRASETYSYHVKIFSLPLIALAAIISLLFGLWFSAGIVRPLRALLGAVEPLGNGDFSVHVAETGSMEVATLARSFNRLGRQLADYVRSLKQEVAARQEVESEIKIARSLQEALLPKHFPENPGIDLAAQLQPAREVAGDFYDCFMLDGKLTVIIGDVSGKGVPAAFFMAVVRTMLRDLCHTMKESTPAAVMTRANQLLCCENDSCMFVTLFLGMLDIEKGVLYYANGGHNEVLRRRSDGTVDRFGYRGDMALGIIPDNHYHDCSEPLHSGEMLVLFTDGITEAFSPQQVLYGVERLSDVVGCSGALSAAALCRKVVADVIDYECGNRFDDITIVALKYCR
ncbi:MAG: SpoIIE family protein phosphatase [Victivallales bacterium]|nr:SpoIIE family protein phosphatase [Victivallales bacterium]